MNKNKNNIETKRIRMLTDEEAEQVTGGQNSDILVAQATQFAKRKSEIGFSFKEVEDAGSVTVEEN